MNSQIKRTLLGAVLAVPVLGVAPALANEGSELLRSMQSAVHSLSYHGKLVFSKGGELSEYQIEHQPGQGSSADRGCTDSM